MNTTENPPSELHVASKLKGKTLLVYWYLLKRNSPVGVREVQKALNFSSPSVAHYHLNKLVELGLAEIKSGNYRLMEKVNIGILRDYIMLKGVALPRYVFYASFFTTALMIYLLFYPQTLTVHNLIALIFAFSATIISWIETLKAWKEKPF